MCEFCEGEEKLYQTNRYGKLFISNFGIQKVLIVEANYCPPYSACYKKDFPLRMVFPITYCPECGRNLNVV